MYDVGYVLKLCPNTVRVHTTPLLNQIHVNSCLVGTRGVATGGMPPPPTFKYNGGGPHMYWSPPLLAHNFFVDCLHYKSFQSP